MQMDFGYSFIDESSNSKITFEYAEEGDEALLVDSSGDISVMYVNKSTCLVLARMFAKLSMCDYKEGFHVEIRESFDADKAAVLRVVLMDSSE